MENEVLKTESKSKRKSVNEWDKVLSISVGQIDQQAHRSVTLVCVRVCVRKLRYSRALVDLQMRSGL